MPHVSAPGSPRARARQLLPTWASATKRYEPDEQRASANEAVSLPRRQPPFQTLDQGSSSLTSALCRLEQVFATPACAKMASIAQDCRGEGVIDSAKTIRRLSGRLTRPVPTLCLYQTTNTKTLHKRRRRLPTEPS